MSTYMNVLELEKTSTVDRCFSPQVAVFGFSLNLPFSISYRLMLSPPALYSLILHLTRLDNWTRSYRQCQPVLAKGDPYNQDRVPKITWIWGPPGCPYLRVCKFLRHQAHGTLLPQPISQTLFEGLVPRLWMNEWIWFLSLFAQTAGQPSPMRLYKTEQYKGYVVTEVHLCRPPASFFDDRITAVLQIL